LSLCAFLGAFKDFDGAQQFWLISRNENKTAAADKIESFSRVDADGVGAVFVAHDSCS